MAIKKKTEVLDPIDDTEAPEEGTVDVSLEEADDDDEPAAPDPTGGPSRREKKAARQSLREAAAAADTLRAEKESLARELAEERAQRAAAVGFAHGVREAGGHAPKDPLDVEAEQLRRENDDLIQAYTAVQNKLTPEQTAEWRKRAEDLEERKFELRARRRERQAAPSPQQRAADENMQLLRARYPDVCSNPRAFQEAVLEHRLRVTQGSPDNWDTTDQVMKSVRGRYKMGDSGKREVDPTLSRKLSGQSKGASGGGGDPPTAVRLKPIDVENALAAFPHIKDEKVRLAHYAKVITKRQRARASDDA